MTLLVYLRAVTVLEPAGNVPADVGDAVHRIAGIRRRWLRVAPAAGPGALVAAVAGVGFLAPGAFGVLLGGPAGAITGKDGAKALLVPGGSFVMGDGEWSPRREVHVEAFSMDQYEVSVALYEKYLRKGGSPVKPDNWEDATSAALRDRPVVGVTCREAEAYCRWAGKRLPYPPRRSGTLDAFDLDFNNKMDRRLVFELATARFVGQRQDAVFLGPPGKNHLVQAIGLLPSKHALGARTDCTRYAPCPHHYNPEGGEGGAPIR